MVSAAGAVIFDFDGLIADTEMPDYLAWQAVYARYGWSFPLHSWLRNVGRNDNPFDALAPFRGPDAPMAADAVLALWREEHERFEHDYLKPLPGVLPLLEHLRRAGIPTAVASSTRRQRIEDRLARLRLEDRFDALACGDEVPLAKPAPDVYRLAARRLGIVPASCVALEDSEPGVHAAKAAGMRCIAVPSQITRGMDFSAADLVVTSLLDVGLETLAGVMEAPSPSRAP